MKNKQSNRIQTLLRNSLFLGVFHFASGWASAEPHVYPVPFVGSQHSDIVFTDLPGAGTLKVFTINGEEVITLSIAPGEALKHWNTQNSSGKKLASGVYLYRGEGGGTEFTGKIVIIR